MAGAPKQYGIRARDHRPAGTKHPRSNVCPLLCRFRLPLCPPHAPLLVRVTQNNAAAGPVTQNTAAAAHYRRSPISAHTGWKTSRHLSCRRKRLQRYRGRCTQCACPGQERPPARGVQRRWERLRVLEGCHEWRGKGILQRNSVSAWLWCALAKA